MDFLFHKISEKEHEEIQMQVRSILESFSRKLSNISKTAEESHVEREFFEREEGGTPAEISKKIMFENAPEKNEDFIIAEKKKW